MTDRTFHLLFFVLLLLPVRSWAELQGELTLTNRYVYRGINYSGGEPALQGLIEVTSARGFYAGIWASTVEWPRDDRTAEVDYFAGYQHRFSNHLALDATLVRYTYLGGDVGNSYDWTEGQLTVHLLDHWSLTLTRANDWAGRGERTGTAEATYRYALRPNWTLDAILGHAEIERALGFNYQWGEVGLSRGFGPVQGRLAYSATRGAEAMGDLARSRWLFSVTWRPLR